MNVCAACGLDFASVRAFDAHRVGKHAHLHSPDHPAGRRCLAAAELLERGWTENDRGRWLPPSTRGQGTADSVTPSSPSIRSQASRNGCLQGAPPTRAAAAESRNGQVRVCRVCQRSLQAHRADASYCSSACRQRAYRIRSREPNTDRAEQGTTRERSQT